MHTNPENGKRLEKRSLSFGMVKENAKQLRLKGALLNSLVFVALITLANVLLVLLFYLRMLDILNLEYAGIASRTRIDMEPSTNITETTTKTTPISDHETTKLANLKAHAHSNPPPLIVPKITLHPNINNPRQKHLTRSSSTNSSPDSPLDDDPFNDSDDDNSSTNSFSPRAHKPNNTLPPPNTSIDLNNNNSNNKNSSATTTTDRGAGPAHRIPSSVFARTTSSGAGADWSVASNESLFSIHGASFRNSHVIGQSGELAGGPTERELILSDHIFSYPVRQPRCTEAMRSRELGRAEATMKEVIQESESHQHYVATLAETSKTTRTSTKSFAFSIKAGDSPKDASSVPEAHVRCQSQMVLPKADDRSAPQPSTNSDPKANPAPPPSLARTRWPSCFSCCSIW
ncbi:presenilin-2 [Striga asiatica]|uniref:Presenilin-2 n=1 Tax=Striga asiatica TaxID=4170 RepID=A0A5A7Q4M4_STRAF|nr:presenilin-2 [Striga asiatica]